MSQVFIHTEESIEPYHDVADIAEVSEGRLQVVYRDQSQDLVNGSIFGGNGRWKMWFEDPDGLHKYLVTDPMKQPEGVHAYQRLHNSSWLTHERMGRIKRLKLSHL